MVDFKVEFYQLPVTALAHCPKSNLLLCGKGPYLHLYTCPEYECIGTKKLFTDHAIHGIEICHDDLQRDIVLVWGGRNLRCIIVDSNSPGIEELSISLSQVCICEDWIIKCCFRSQQHPRSNGSLQAAAITAHNALILLDVVVASSNVARKDPGISLRQRTLCRATQSILYSAEVEWISTHRIVVVGGSPFGSIVVWSLYLSDSLDDLAATTQLHFNHLAHPDAAIFGVKILGDQSQVEQAIIRLFLASCSDDRTVKTWHIPIPLTHGDTNDAYLAAMSSSLGSWDKEIETPRELVCLAKTNPAGPGSQYGHFSRVWVVDTVNFDDDNLGVKKFPLLLSLGEDATAQLWLHPLSSSPKFVPQSEELRHILTYGNHFGKNIWCCTSFRQYERSAIVLGSADGGMTVNSLDRSQISNGTGQQSELHMKDDAQERKNWSKLLKTFEFIGPHDILATTTQGHVLLGQLEAEEHESNDANGTSADKGVLHFRVITQLPVLENYSVITTLPLLKIGFIAGANGDIYMFRNQIFELEPIGHMGGKINALFAKSLVADNATETETPHNPLVVMATNLGGELMRMFFISFRLNASAKSEDQSQRVEGSIKSVSSLDVPKETSSTPTSILCVDLSKSQRWFLVGFRDGRIVKYTLEYQLDNRVSSLGTECKYETSMANATSIDSHDDAVTSMTWTTGDADGGRTNYGYLLSTARDSTYAIHRYSLQDGNAPAELLHRLELPLGPNIEGCYISGSENQLFFYGFRGEEFVIYDNLTNTERFKVSCGGAHRTWSFLPPTGTLYRTSFVWRRASRLYSSTAALSQTRWIEPGSHGREIKAFAIRPRASKALSWPGLLIATGAEDTDIRLHEYNQSSDRAHRPKFLTTAILRKHSTGLQHIQWSQDGRYLFSSGGREEFFIWRINRAPYVNLGVVLESRLPVSGDLSDSRVMGFDVRSIATTTDGSLSVHTKHFIIAMSFSNSFTKVYRYSASASNPLWELLASGIHNTSCLTHLQYLPINPNNAIARDYNVKYYTGSTDGSLIFWQGSLQSDLFRANSSQIELTRGLSIRMFQNTIKCFTVIPVRYVEDPGYDIYALIGCGDDNALAVTITRQWNRNWLDSKQVDLSETSPHTATTFLVPRAHAASINALVAWRSSENSVLHAESNAEPPASNASEVTVRIVTASNDQTLRVWDALIQLDKQKTQSVTVSKVATIPSSVADASSLDVLEEDIANDKEPYVRVVLCGVGLEIWRIPKTGRSLKIIN